MLRPLSQPQEGRHSMNKLDLKNMDFCPPRKWLAVPKNEDYAPQIFSLDDTGELEDGRLEFWPKEGLPLWPKWIRLFACHLCGFTGYCDSKGDDVYGGHVVEDTERGGYGVVCWRKDDAGWFVSWFNHPVLAASRISSEDHIIGHIHQPDSWSKILSDSEVPEEVAELLKTLSGEGLK